MNSLVTVIIPTTNEELSMAEKCAASVRASTYKNIKVIIVNENMERSAQRNIGIGLAEGEYLLFLDSDQCVAPELIEECVRLMNFGYGAIYIPEIIKTKGVFAYIRNWEKQFYNATPIDCVRFVRASHCPRFDENLNGPEDSDWDRRVPGVRIISQNPLYHNDNISFITYFKKKAYYAESMAKFAKKWPDDKVLDWKWRCFGVFFEGKKYKRVLKRLDLMLLAWCLIFVRGLIYLKVEEFKKGGI